MTTDLQVRLPGGTSTNDFFHASNLYFHRHFSKWFQGGNTFYCFPAIFESTFRESSDPEASGRKEMERKLKDIAEGDIKGQAAEYEVWKVFNKFAPEFETSVFFFRGSNFCKNTHGMFLNILLSNHYGKETDAELGDMEGDCIVFDKSGHIIVLETKGSNKLTSGTLSKGRKQTRKSEHLLRCLNKLVGGRDEIPIQQFRVFPFVTEKARGPSLVTGADLDLANFPTWWKTVIDPHKERVPLKEHQAILEALIGLLSAQCDFSGASASSKGSTASVALETNMLEAERLKTRDEEIKAQKVKTKKTQTDMVITKGFPFRKNRALTIYNLTPEQLDVFNSNHRCLIINGVAGCGKTILIQMKSLELAKNNEKVKVMVPHGMVKEYEDFYRRNDVLDKVNVYPHSADNMYTEDGKYLINCLAEQSDDYNLFFDDMQTELTCGDNDADVTFAEFFSSRFTSTSLCTWIAVDFQQQYHLFETWKRQSWYAVRERIDESIVDHVMSERFTPYATVKLRLSDEEMQKSMDEKDYFRFKRYQLRSTMRNCKEIFEFLKKVFRANVVAEGPIFISEPLSYHLGHSLHGSMVEIHFARLDDSLESFAQLGSERFHQEIGKIVDFVLVDLKEKYAPADIAILSFDFEDSELMTYLEKHLNHKVVFDYVDGQCTGTDILTSSPISFSNVVLSKEWPAVILVLKLITEFDEISPDVILQNLYMGASRARTTLVLIGTEPSVELIENIVPGLDVVKREHIVSQAESHD